MELGLGLGSGLVIGSVVRARHAAHFSRKNGQQQASVRARARARVSYRVRVRVRGACSLLEEEGPAA